MKKEEELSEILSDLIYRDLLGMLDEEEQKRLNILCRTYHIRDEERESILARMDAPERFETEGAYRRFAGYVRWRSWQRFRKLAAVILLLLGIGGGFYFYTRSSAPSDVLLVGDVMPGSSKATITLANGEKVELEKLTQQWKETDGTLLRATAGELVYGHSGEEDRLIYNTIEIPRGGEYRLVLADGTKVWLNAGTQLRYPVRFTADTREVFLKGEAYFEVARDEQKSFIVSASMGRIQVLGTCFNVRDYAEESRVVTTLESGQVRYITANQNRIDLLPGYSLEDRGGTLVPQKVNTALYTAWKDGKYIFEGASVEEIMSTLERWYDVVVFYENEKVKHLHFTGDLERYATINTILNFMETGGDVRFKVNDRTILVYEK